MTKASRYRTLATILWLAVGILGGITAAAYFDTTPRRLVFLVVLAVGLIVIVRLNAPRRAVAEQERQLPLTTSANNLAPPQHPKEQTPHTPLAPAAPANPVDDLLSRSADGSLPPDEARAWLDDFLIKQQEK